MTQQEFIDLVEEVYRFHTKRAPGIVIGVEMVDLARRKLGVVEKLGAVSETQVCLSDVIQYMTGCTIGNKYLIMRDRIGRYALTLYDRKDGRGVRVFVNQKKLDSSKMPELCKFFLRKRAPEVANDMEARKESAEKIVAEFLAADRNIFGWQFVRVKDYKKPPVHPVKLCPDCHESFICPDEDEKTCQVCSGDLDYYQLEQ